MSYSEARVSLWNCLVSQSPSPAQLFHLYCVLGCNHPLFFLCGIFSEFRKMTGMTSLLQMLSTAAVTGSQGKWLLSSHQLLSIDIKNIKIYLISLICAKKNFWNFVILCFRHFCINFSSTYIYFQFYPVRYQDYWATFPIWICRNVL